MTAAAAKTPSTQAQIRASLLASLAPSPLAGWSTNAPQRLLVDGVSARIAEQSALRAQLARSVDPRELLDLDDDWTDAFLARFGDEAARIPALAAVWDVPITCLAAVAPITLGPTSSLVVQAGGGAVFELAQPAEVTLSAGSSYAGTVRMRARAVGSGGNAFAAPRIIVTGPAGLTIGSPVLYTAGREAESNAAAITRALARWARLGAGWTLQAFDSLVPEAAPSITRWRARDDAPRGEGTVLVVLANASGAATSTKVGLVQDHLGSRAVKPLGSGRFIAEATAVDALAIALTIESDGTNATLAADAQAAVLALCDAFPLGRATLDDGLVRAVAIGGGFKSISVDTGDGQAVITPSLPGFAGAKSIVSCSLASQHGIPTDGVLVATVAITVV